MKLIKQTLFLSVISLLLGGTVALAEVKDYSEADFNKSLASGTAVALDFHANWCPTCRAQAKAFETLGKEAKLAEVPIYRVDYDNSDALKEKYGVSKQSTLILFKDGKEIDRNMGVTGIDELSAFLSKGL